MTADVADPVSASWHVFRRRSLPGRPAWERRYSLALVALDVLGLSLAAILAQFLRFGSVDSFLSVSGGTVAYAAVGSSMVSAWLAVIALSGGYSAGVVGVGSEEFRRILNPDRSPDDRGARSWASEPPDRPQGIHSALTEMMATP